MILKNFEKWKDKLVGLETDDGRYLFGFVRGIGPTYVKLEFVDKSKVLNVSVENVISLRPIT